MKDLDDALEIITKHFLVDMLDAIRFDISLAEKERNEQLNALYIVLKTLCTSRSELDRLFYSVGIDDFILEELGLIG